MANEFPEGESCLQLVTLWNAKPFRPLKTELVDWADNMHITIWENVWVGRTTGTLCGDPIKNRTREVLNLSRMELSLLMEFLTRSIGSISTVLVERSRECVMIVGRVKKP